MTTSTIHSDIRARIDLFLEQLSTLVRRAALDSVRSALGDEAAPAKRGPGRPRLGRPPMSTVGSTGNSTDSTGKSSRKSAGGKRSTEEVDQTAERIRAFVNSNPGLGLEAIAKGIGTSTKELKLPVIKLLSTRALSKKGQKRGTKYFAGGHTGPASRPAPAKKAAKKTAKKARRKSGKKAKRAARKAPVAVAA